MSDAPSSPSSQAGSSNKGLKRLPPMTSPGHRHKYEIHNALFAKEDSAFKQACDKAGVKATTRQASKWRNKRGSAYHAK